MKHLLVNESCDLPGMVTKSAQMTNVKKTESVSASETKVGFLGGINNCSIQPLKMLMMINFC